MKVWVVSRGKRGDGQDVCAIFSNYKAAEKYALGIKHAFAPWAPTPTKGVWESGCDLVCVTEYIVNGARSKKARSKAARRKSCVKDGLRAKDEVVFQGSVYVIKSVHADNTLTVAWIMGGGNYTRVVEASDVTLYRTHFEVGDLACSIHAKTEPLVVLNVCFPTVVVVMPDFTISPFHRKDLMRVKPVKPRASKPAKLTEGATR